MKAILEKIKTTAWIWPVLLLSAMIAFPLGTTLGKYVWDGSAGSFTLSVSSSQTYTYNLEDGPAVRAALTGSMSSSMSSNTSVKKVVFGTTAQYSGIASAYGESRIHVGVTSEDAIYVYCQGAETVYVLAESDKDVTIKAGASCQRMFYSMTGLTEIDGLSILDTSNTTDMLGMFCLCSALSELDLSSFDTGNVTTMNEMFYMCSSLQSLNLNGFDTGKVTDMYMMFCGCSSLQNLDLSSFNTSKITGYRGLWDVFNGCSALRTIYAGDGWTMDQLSSYLKVIPMFTGCTSLVGGSGTTFTSDKATYARIDGGSSDPGYFTAKSTRAAARRAALAVAKSDISVDVDGLSHITAKLGREKPAAGEDYSLTLDPDEGYTLPQSVTVLLDEAEYTVLSGKTEDPENIAYNSETGLLTIPGALITEELESIIIRAEGLPKETEAPTEEETSEAVTEEQTGAQIEESTTAWTEEQTEESTAVQTEEPTEGMTTAQTEPVQESQTSAEETGQTTVEPVTESDTVQTEPEQESPEPTVEYRQITAAAVEETAAVQTEPENADFL